VSTGRVLGGILFFAAFAILVVSTLWLLVGRMGESLTTAAAVLGFGIVLVVLVLPLAGGGIYLFRQGTAEAKELAEIAKERKILNIVSTQGQVQIADAALQAGLSREQVKQYLYDLVGKGLFTGYVNWKDGILYARSAGDMQTTKCPNCGATRSLVGKGVVQCEYCGAELFV
jgi:hypothetical protein